MSKVGFIESRKSPQHYFEWRKNRARPAVDKVKEIRNLDGAFVVDIGCGYGSLSSLLLDEGAIVTSTEASQKKLEVAKDLFKDRKNITLKHVTNEKLDLPDASQDVVFMFDVIEHVEHPDLIIDESRRVLKNGGVLYVEFTPYYSITGHHLYDYAKWPIHILPKEKIKQIVYKKGGKGFLTADDLWEQFESLNKLKISRFQKMVRDFKKVEERFIIKYPEKFELNIPFINALGSLKDLFTMSFEGIYIKQT